MHEALKKKQQLRLVFLNKIYEMSNGNADVLVNGAEVAHQIGLKDGEEDQLRAIVNYLEGERLIKANWVVGGLPASVRLTHAGLREIEDALEHPDRPTQHFMPTNVLYVGQMLGSTIQQGTIGSSQTVQIGSDSIEEIRVFIKQLKHSLDELDLNKDLRGEINAEVATVEAQLASPKPKTSILKEGLISIRRILEGAAGSAIGAQIAKQIPALLALLS